MPDLSDIEALLGTLGIYGDVTIHVCQGDEGYGYSGWLTMHGGPRETIEVERERELVTMLENLLVKVRAHCNRD